MKPITLFTWIMATCLWGPAVDADIYVWTDESGIRHFSNRDSNPEAELFLKTMEGPYEEAVERAYREAQKQRELQQAQAQIQEEKERLAEKVAELERRTEAAKREAQEALDRAEAIEAAAARRLRDDRWYATGTAYYPGYYLYSPYGYRGYRFSVTYPGGKRFKDHRYRPGATHRQIHRDGYRNRDRHPAGSRYSRPRQPLTGQVRPQGHRRGEWRR
ncbi:MAG: DUF4124 domain-containing protein [Desulfobacteraceae bacterium]|nr:DUF4124 domain-containing protein [Desulfobacteraceae bacterium]MBC2750322.1 DUF4124 domain-containing protein [Desulfobacteraceae bacterium]